MNTSKKIEGVEEKMLKFQTRKQNQEKCNIQQENDIS